MNAGFSSTPTGAAFSHHCFLAPDRLVDAYSVKSKGISLQTSLECYGESVKELAGRIGLPATLALVEAYGGLTLRIPLGVTTPGKRTLETMSAHIGEEATQKLVAVYGGTALYVPSCRYARLDERDQAINQERDTLAQEGLSERALVTVLARKYNLSDRHIWRILKKSW